MTKLRSVLAFSAVVLRGLMRDKTALLFMVVLPVVIIVIIGTTFGGTERLDIGIVRLDHGPLTDALVADLEGASGVRAHQHASVAEAQRAVRRRVVAAAVVIEPGTEARLADGQPADLGFVANPASDAALTARTTLGGLLARNGAAVVAGRLVSEQLHSPLQDNIAAARSLASEQGATVEVTDVGDRQARKISRFALVAPQELVLFVFINAMASAVICVQARRAGVLRRALATRTSMAAVITGLALGWFSIALLQSLIILGVGSLLFGVDWGDPLAAAALVVAFALVGCGAGLVVGAIGRNEDRVGALTPIVGMVCGALGGCMVPFEVFPPAMRTLARAVPHYWAITAWQELIFRGGDLGSIGTQLVVLGGFATGLLVLAAARLRRELVHG